MTDRFATDRFTTVKRYATPLLLLLPEAMTLLVTRLRFPMLSDEVRFHLPSILIMKEGLERSVPPLQLIGSYNAANGPMPYLVFWAWGSAFSFEPQWLRALSVIFAAGSVFVFCVLLRHLSVSRPIAYSWLLVSWPYFFLYSNTLLVHSMQLFFLSAALFALYKGLVAIRMNAAWWLLGILAAALAMLTRQTSVVIIGAWAVYLILRAISLHRPRALATALVLLAICIVLLGTLMFAWAGLVPPAFQEGHHVALSPEAVFLFGISVAVFFAPLLPSALRGQNGVLGVGICGTIVGIAYLFSALSDINRQPLTTSKGIVPYIFEMLDHRCSDIVIVIFQLILATLGLTVAWRIITGQRRMLSIIKDRTLANGDQELVGLLRVTILASLPAALFTNRLYELYLITTYPWMLALSARIRIPRWLLLVWLACQFSLAIAYFWVKAYLQIG